MPDPTPSPSAAELSGAAAGAPAPDVGGAGPPPQPAAGPAAASPPGGAAGYAGPGAPAAGAQAGQAGQGASDYMGVREALAAYGVDLRGQFGDDHAALQHLALAYRQAQQSGRLAEYGQLYLDHADQFQAYLRQQQQPRPQQQPQEQWWKAPEYDPAWLSQITRDPTTGELRALPGQDPAVVRKYQEWTNHQRSFMERLSQDPIKALRPGLEEVARQVAQDMVSQHLGGYREQQTAAGFVAENSGWLHAREQDGSLARDPATGRPVLTEWGQRFAQYVRQAEHLGLRDVQGQQTYALGLVQRDYLASQARAGQPQAQAPPQGQGQGQGQAAPPDQNQQARDAFLASAQAARSHPNAAGSVDAGAAGGPGGPGQNAALPLRDRMKSAFERNGYQLSQPVVTGR